MKTMDEKIKLFLEKSGGERFSNKTPIDDIPIEFIQNWGERPGDENCGGMCAQSLTLWCRFANSDWFNPYGGFSKFQIIDMLKICNNDNQIISLMELLSAKK